MNIIIFPGGGSPYNQKYKEVYAILEKEASAYGYKNIVTLMYPGHIDENGKVEGKLNLDSSIEIAISKIQEYDSRGIQYDFLGRSYGTIVAVKTAISIKPRRLRKIILWGPPPYWIMWKLFVRDLKETIKTAEAKGLSVDETFFSSLVPLEPMLEVLERPTVIATGTKDIYSQPAFIGYLKSSLSDKNNFFFKEVDGAPHEVTYNNCSKEVVTDYLNKLFT